MWEFGVIVNGRWRIIINEFVFFVNVLNNNLFVVYDILK